jgi:hypothetical protein
MSAIKLEQFGGMLPAWDNTLLPHGQASLSINGYLFSGGLTGWRQPKLLRQLNNSSAQAAFRIPKITKAAATATLRFTSNVVAGNTVTVGEETYTFTATVTNPYDVLLGASAPDSAANLFAALTVGVGEGLLYGGATVANPSISIITADNTVNGSVITIKAPDYGEQYNTTTVSSVGANMAWDNPTFVGGHNPTADNTITGPSTWLEFLDQNTDVMKSPVVGDTFDRYYAASPSLPPQYNTHDRIDAGMPWWLLGVPPPGCAPGVDVTGGGDVASLGNVNTETSDIFQLNANTAYLMQITPPGAMSLQDVTFNFQGADALTIHIAALLYSDDNGVPGTLLSTGDVLTPAPSQQNMILSFSNPPGLTQGVPYWIGLVCDTGIQIQQSNTPNSIPPGIPPPSGYTFKTPFTSIPSSAPPVEHPVKVTNVVATDKPHSLFTVTLDTPLAGPVYKGDSLKYGTMQNGIVYGLFAVVYADAPAGATVIEIQVFIGQGCPAVGIAITDLTNPGSITGAPVGGVSPPIKHNFNLQMWADLSTASLVEARAYFYTYVTEYDEEGPPSPPTLITGWSNATWTIDLFQPPADDMGKVRNIKTVRIYRTISGSTGNAVYYWVADVPVGTAQYVDNVDDSVIALNYQLASTNWFPPPAGLQGFKSMPNGVTVAWKGNELWFCEPYRPHAWPIGYVQTTEFPIVGIGVVGQAVVACTSAYPYIAQGASPSSMSVQKIMFPEPCIARCSVVSAADGVYYQSPNGLIKVAPSGVASNTTELWITREKWKKLVPASPSIQAIMQSSCYFAFGTTSDPTPGIARMGYTIEINPADAQSFTIWPQPGGHRIGFCQLTAPNGYDIDNLFVDQWTGIGLIIQNGQIWYYDFTDTAPTITPYKWRSKTYQSQTKNNYAAMKVFFDIPPGSPTQSAVRNETPTLDPSWLTLGANQYGIVRVYADNVLVTTREIRNSGELLRILAGFKADQWYFELEGRVAISSVHIATSVKELAQAGGA